MRAMNMLGKAEEKVGPFIVVTRVCSHILLYVPLCLQ